MRNPLPSLAALTLTIFAGAASVSADEKAGIARDLPHYFPIRAALAADKTDGVKEHAEHLAKSDDKAIAKAGEDLAKAKDIAAARAAFGDLSKAVIASVEAASRKGEKLPAVFVFDCSMTKPYGKWVQESKAIGNPYQGAKMPRCGKLVGTHGSE